MVPSAHLSEVGPTVRGREVGARLRQLRSGLDLTTQAVASKLRCSATKIRRIETGARRASLRDVQDLCGIYEVSKQETEELIRLASQAREPSWWTHYEDLRLSPYIGLEQDAVAITVFSMYWVPALLQTEDYTRAMITGIARKIEPSVLKQRIEARIRRQDLLNRDKPPRYRALLDEAVLHRKVGGSSVMAEQLDKILQFAQDEKVTVQIIPFEAGAHASADSNFEFLEFRDPAHRNVVFVEGLYSNQYQEKEAEPERYSESIEYLRYESMSPKDSLTLIADIRKTYAT